MYHMLAALNIGNFMLLANQEKFGQLKLNLLIYTTFGEIN